MVHLPYCVGHCGYLQITNCYEQEYCCGGQFLARNLSKRVHNEIDSMQKPCEALPSQVFLKVIQGQRTAKGHVKSPMGTVPLGTTAKFIKLMGTVQYLTVLMPTSVKLRYTTFTVLNLA